MKSRITAALFPVAIAGLYLAMNQPASKKITVYESSPIAPVLFPIGSWDAVPNAVGYYIYIGEKPNNPVGKIKLDLQVNLHGVTQVPVLHNTPVTYASVSAYGLDGKETARSNEDHYP
jgi:hypothetical protein